MGITIHFSGRLRHFDLIDKLAAEVADIAEILGWSYEKLDDNRLRGILVTFHKDCDTLALLADREGFLQFPVEPLDDASRYVFVKTQFAPIEVHIVIVKLLRHLKNRYFAELEVTDEGGYWETGDQGELVKRRCRLAAIMDRVAAALDHVERPADDAPIEDLVSRVEDAIKNISLRSLDVKDDDNEDT